MAFLFHNHIVFHNDHLFWNKILCQGDIIQPEQELGIFYLPDLILFQPALYREDRQEMGQSAHYRL